MENIFNSKKIKSSHEGLYIGVKSNVQTPIIIEDFKKNTVNFAIIAVPGPGKSFSIKKAGL